VPDGRIAGQPLNRADAGEVVADETEPTLRIKALAVESDDAGRLLAAMLEGVKAERGKGRGIRVIVDAEDAALFAQPVPVGIETFDVGPALCATR
jgi:hypothetical protein